MDWVVNVKIFDPHNPVQLIYKKLMKHLIDYCDENLIDSLDDNEHLEKIKNKVNNYVNSYAIYDDWFQEAHVIFYIFRVYIYFLENY